ncbi:MAG: helix-turn-helix domain-containing protein [Propionibacteriaceae bacterium]|jgi:transcriptional regulator GlxA family with amidase domain|nr:helix-turn-helix domain-containing protein [Propionibacteriaceae bacterium]
MRVGILAADQVRAFDIAAALEVFGSDRSARGVPLDSCLLAAPADRVALARGVSIATAPLAALGEADLVIIPGLEDPLGFVGSANARVRDSWLEAVGAAAARGAQVASLCAGAFLFAATGLLDGGEATTHWRWCDELARRHPKVRVQRDVLYTHDPARGLWTSAGVSAGIDLCLAIKGWTDGQAAAAEVARSMVLPAARRGGQAQYVPPRHGANEAPGGEFEELCRALRADLAHPWSLAQMARLAHTAPRTLQRRFGAQFGLTPARWLTEQRVVAAQELLTGSTLGVEEIAARVGFSSAGLLRQHFGATVGTTPTRYRESFGCGAGVDTSQSGG